MIKPKNRPPRKPLLVITGPDGAGKSSLSQVLVGTLLPALGFRKPRPVSLWESLRQSQFAASKAELYAYLAELSPRARSLLIMHGLQQALDAALADDSDILVYDAYWYKYWVSELGLGVDHDYWQAFAATLPEPDLTVFLSVSPETAWQRKSAQNVTSYECGLKPASRVNFLAFQRRLQRHWQAGLASELPWAVHLNSETCSALALSQQIEPFLLQLGFAHDHLAPFPFSASQKQRGFPVRGESSRPRGQRPGFVGSLEESYRLPRT